MPDPSPADPVRVRDARPADRDVIAAFNQGLALETENKRLDPEVLSRGVEHALADPDRLRYWVAESPDGRVIGQAAISREWSDWRCGWLWWLQSVYVEAAWRGRGVFAAIYRRIRAEAKARDDVIGLRLYVENENSAAQAIYRALGLAPGGYHVYEDIWGVPGQTP
jgi:GNAT superfamily N-acetyltransferase